MADIGLSNTYGLYTTMSNGLYTGTVGGGGSSTSTEAFRNLIINGGMIVDQRLEGSSQAINNNGDYYVCDRFFFRTFPTSLPAYTIQRVIASDADNSVTGQHFSIRAQATSNVNIGTAIGNIVGFFHFVEGAVAAPMQWGTSNGQTASLSFYIKTNVAGTHWFAIKDYFNINSYIGTFNVSSSNTYTKITKSIPPPPANSVWMTDSNVCLKLSFDVCKGGPEATTNNTWLTGDFNYPAGLTGSATSNMWGLSNTYVELAGVQLEVGSKATNFEYRPFTLEKMLCERYFEKSHPNGVTLTTRSAPGFAAYMLGSNSSTQISLSTRKRAVPTIKFYNPYSNVGNSATDLVYSSNLTVYAPNITKFGVTSTESNLWNRNVYFNWVADAEAYINTYYTALSVYNSGGPLTDFVVNVNIPYKNGFASNFQDLRFYDNTNTLLSHWYESVVNNSNANVWLRIPLLANGMKIGITVGNSATSGAPSNVFSLYEDFSSLNTSTKWTSNSASYTSSSNNFSITANNFTYLVTQSNYPADFVLESSVRSSSSQAIPELAMRGNVGSNIGIKCRGECRSNLGGTGSLLDKPFVLGSWNFLSINAYNLTFPSDNTSQVMKFSACGSNFQFYYNNSNLTNYSDPRADLNISSGVVGIMNHNGAPINFEWVRGYKSTSNVVSVISTY